MSVLGPMQIEANDIAVAWGRLFLHLFDASKATLSPALVSITTNNSQLPTELQDVREAVDAALETFDLNIVRVSALTIFPFDMWCRRNKPNCEEFSALCVNRLLPRLKKRDSRNRLGTYFERMMAYTGTRKNALRTVNQLQFVIDLLKHRSKWPRESALQITCFDPAKDHTGQPVRGFPCLQQVGIAHDGDGKIAVNAYYPTQYIFDRAYGNYLGLCHLGAFIAHETDLEFVRLNCFVGKPELGTVSKKSIAALAQLVRSHVQS